MARNPRTSRVIQTPVVKPNGEILDKPGYDPDTKLYFLRPSELKIPDIPTHPNDEDVKEAKYVLEEVFRDFPFSTEADFLICLL